MSRRPGSGCWCATCTKLRRASVLIARMLQRNRKMRRQFSALFGLSTT